MAGNDATHPALSSGAVAANSASVTAKQPTQNRANVLGNASPAANAVRVAQASSQQPTDKQILDQLFPDQMKAVNIRLYSAAPSYLVRFFKYDAWTNSKTEIFIQPPAKVGGFQRIMTLYHEGLHILQFRREKGPELFRDMLKYEVQAYGKTAGWLDSAQALELQKGHKDARSVVDKTRANAAFLFRLGAAIGDEVIEARAEGANDAAVAELYQEMMIENGMLPDLYTDPENFIRYEIGDMYKNTGKSFLPL